VLLTGFAIRAHNLGEECFDCDELYAVRIQGKSLRTLGAVMGRDAFHSPHPLLSNVPFVFWNAMVGKDEAHVRALPLLFGLAAIFLTYRLGLRLGCRNSAILAALLLAINPLHIAYSREARPYAFFVMLTLAAHLFFLRCVQNGGRTNRLGYAICVTLALLTHYFAVPALAAHGVVALWLAFRGTPPIRRSALAAFLTLILAILPFVAWLPMLPYQAATNSQSYMLPATATQLLRCLREVEGLGIGLTPLSLAAGGLAVFLVVLGVWDRRHNSIPAEGADLNTPLPRWAAIAFLLGGLVAAPMLFLASPKYIQPTAEATLVSYGYDAETIERELLLLRVELTAFALAAAAGGVLVLAWSRLIGLLERLPILGRPSEHPLSVAGFVAALLLMPLAVVRAVDLLGVHFLTTRNMLILAPIGSLALALGLNALLQQRLGRVLAAVSILGLAAAACQYEPIARLWGGEGSQLGFHTAPWRDLEGNLNELPDKVPLLLNKNPATDPALYYLSSYHPQRTESVAEAPSRFRLIHLENSYLCKSFLDALKERGATLTVLSRHGALILFDVSFDQTNNRS
jgi:4-amino-4-deoxy-L-arabinose transferase-like glycosyltransferase